MEKINFVDGELVKSGYVLIDEIQHEVVEAEYTGDTPLSAHTLNLMQDNIEKSAIIISDNQPTSKEKVWLKNTETEKKIYCKNENGEFEEFVDIDEINKTSYSTEEQVVGTWIDGKPLYKKTISFVTGTNYGTWLTHEHGISNVEHIMITNPTYLWNNEKNIVLPDLHTQFGITPTAISYVILNEGSLYGGKEIWVTVEYTKTTD